MKKIILKSLALTNFRGIKELTVDFHDVVTNISGENGTGKSTIFDAFTWLLFGKDAQDRKDYDIKPWRDGDQMQKLTTSVDGFLTVAGEGLHISRSFVEDWVKPRGQMELVFKGNHTETNWNGSPILVSEYQKRINGIIDDTIFKMITNPLFFANLPWQEQREQLFALAGTITNEEIAGSDPEFSALLGNISGKPLADYKRELSAKKKLLKSDLEQIQPRIDQTYKLMPLREDYALIEGQIAAIERRIEEIDKAMADKVESMRQQASEQGRLQREINDLEVRRQAIVHARQMDLDEAIYGANAEHRKLKLEIDALSSEIDGCLLSEKRKTEHADSLLSDKEKAEARRDAERARWFDENAKEYDGSDTCYACGQALPEEKKVSARQAFEKNKLEMLKEITAAGTAISNDIASIEAAIVDEKNEQARIHNDISERKSRLEILNARIETMQLKEPRVIDPKEIEEVAEFDRQIGERRKMLASMNGQPVDTSTLQARKAELNTRRDELKSRLSNRDRIKQFESQIAELENKGKMLAQEIADAEHSEFIMQRFSKARVEECEKRINGLFATVKFKLFERTIDGNESEACIPLVEGIPFTTANRAGCINAGLDIINALCRFYDTTAPIFIDNRESVNDIIQTESQIINLVVSRDRTLQIK